MLSWLRGGKSKTAQEIYDKHLNEIDLPFNESFKENVTIDSFLYVECENKIQEIQATVPLHLLDYVAFVVIADDFYEIHKPLLIYENGYLFLTKKYFENYSKFCATEQ